MHGECTLSITSGARAPPAGVVVLTGRQATANGHVLLQITPTQARALLTAIDPAGHTPAVLDGLRAALRAGAQ